MALTFWDPQGPIAAAQKAHLLEVLWLTMVAIVPVFILVPFLVWRYRYRHDKKGYRPTWDESFKLETLMWGGPIVIIGILAVMLAKQTFDLDPYKPIRSDQDTLNVHVVGLDWKWLFIYPDHGIATVGEFGFPQHHPVAMQLTSDTVMQSFMIPAVAGQIYTMSGMRTKLHFVADRPGTFLGENTQYNGKGFSQQRFAAVSLAADDFADWVAKVKSTGRPLDDAGYAELAKPSLRSQVHAEFGTSDMPDGVVYFSQVDPGLFNRIMAKYRSGKPIEGTNQPGGAAYDPASRAGLD